MKAPTIIILVVVAILAVAGISLLSGRPVSDPAAKVRNGTEAAPSFSLQDLSGETIALADYKGVKPVVLDFWTTWCPNCRRDMPRLDALYQKYKDKIEVIGINMQESPSLVEKTISDWGVSFPIALDPQGIATRAYGARYTNYHVLINKDGNIIKTIPGDISESDILSLIK